MATIHRDYWAQIFQSTSHEESSRVRFRQHDPVELHSLLRHTTPKLTDQDRAYLDAPFTANDFYWAIKTSLRNKAPGYDGLPVEYYQLFISTWAIVFELVYSAQLSKGRLTKFQRRATVTLLYKKGDRSIPSNYRPITLLNHDAKLGPKILAFRLRKVLPKLLHTD